jgi:hypothetical protein
MRSFILPATIVALLAAPMAFASTTTNGTVKSIDTKTMTLILDNGIAYRLPENFKNPGLKPGEKVAVIWDMSGANHNAKSVTLLK